MIDIKPQIVLDVIDVLIVAFLFYRLFTMIKGTRASQIKRPLQDLVACLRKELAFPQGVYLMTGTGIVPPDDFSLEWGDRVRITIGELTLENDVEPS
jgi:2-dehydro-3-deoxy-D-arabinonate dehydratase